MKATTIILTAAAFGLASCAGSSSTQSNGSDSTAIAADSVAVETTAAVEDFSTPDLIYAEVKGHVKKITEIFDNQEYALFEFDKDGVYKSGSRLEYVQKLKRDAENRIIGGDNGYFKVIWEDGKVKQTIVNESDGTLLTESFIYNEDGNLVKRQSASEGPEGDYSSSCTYTYGPDSFDEHGNWIKRSVHYSDPEMKDSTEERKIYYY